MGVGISVANEDGDHVVCYGDGDGAGSVVGGVL